MRENTLSGFCFIEKNHINLTDAMLERQSGMNNVCQNKKGREPASLARKCFEYLHKQPFRHLKIPNVLSFQNGYDSTAMVLK